MSSPQLEDGFTRLANELLEAVMLHGFTQRQLLILLAVIRKTYGYGKKEDDMSASQIGQLCKISRNHATDAINQLVALNVLTKRAGVYGQIIGINKNHKQWKKTVDLSSTKSGLADSTKDGLDSTESGLCEVVPNRDSTSTESGRVDSPKSGHTKENLSKETNKRKRREETSLAYFLDACKEKEERPIRDYKPLWEFSKTVGIPDDFVALAWAEFCRRHTGDSSGAKKRQKDWRQTFRNYVENNYMGLWAIDGSNQYFLTTKGKQAAKYQENNND